VLWERLAYARPVSVAWPETLLQKLQAIDPLQHSHSQGNPLAGEPQLWNCIGRWYLDRGHHQAALVAFKRAEAGVSDSVTKQFLRFRQARALVLLDQTGPATAILVSMANDSRSPCARPALALLGSMRLQAGQATQGLHLLKKAVEPEDALEWLERADAEADLALALLMVGDEASGLQRLHRAQQRFEQQDAFESLTLSLFNEANYLAEQKKKSEAEILRQRLQSLERL